MGKPKKQWIKPATELYMNKGESALRKWHRNFRAYSPKRYSLRDEKRTHMLAVFLLPVASNWGIFQVLAHVM